VIVIADGPLFQPRAVLDTTLLHDSLAMLDHPPAVVNAKGSIE
jgi:hypothetical protein